MDYIFNAKSDIEIFIISGDFLNNVFNYTYVNYDALQYRYYYYKYVIFKYVKNVS